MSQLLNPPPVAVELGYAEVQAGVTVTAAVADIPGLSIPIVVGGRPFYLECCIILQFGKGTDATVSDPIHILVTLVDISGPTNVASYAHRLGTPASTNLQATLFFRKRMNPGPGNYTYKAQISAPVLPAGANALTTATAAGPSYIAAYQA